MAKDQDLSVSWLIRKAIDRFIKRAKMLANLRYKGIKVRHHGSHALEAKDKFTGTVAYSVVGSLNREECAFARNREKAAAIRRVSKLDRAIAEGPLPRYGMS